MSEAAGLLQESDQPDRIDQHRKYEIEQPEGEKEFGEISAEEFEQSPAKISAPEVLSSGQRSALSLPNGSVVSHQPPTWQDILWREWRNTNDETYAEYLFELVADEPAGNIATLINTLLGLLYGGVAGLLIGLISTLSQSLSATAWPILAGIGAALGGGGSLVAQLLWQRQLSWRAWLARLTLNMAPHELGLLGSGLFLVMLGGLFGWLIGLSAGLGHTVGIIALGILLAGGLGARVVGWMVGLGREPNANYLHKYRAWWFWWRERPLGFEVESAVQRACDIAPAAQNKWVEVLQNLAHRKKRREPLEKLIVHLQSRNWVERFTAAHLLAASGGEAVRHLQPIASRITSPQRRTAIRLLQGIELETTARLAEQADYLLCPHCLARCGSHSVSISGETKITFYGCRMCGQSREFWGGEVVAVLDANMGVEPLRQNDTVRINWLGRRELFDFHSVGIVRASDEDVERFAVQVGNDTDPFRRPGYQQMRCTVDPTCGLSENTLRILARIFGQVIESRRAGDT